MSNRPLQGGEVFEITDYTTASDWERFLANLEEVVTEWGLNKQSGQGHCYRALSSGCISSGLWREKHDTIRLGNLTFDLRLQFMTESDNSKLRDNNAQDPSSTKQEDRSESSDCKSDSPQFEDADDGGHDQEWGQSEDDRELLEENTETLQDQKHGEHELDSNLPECLRDLIDMSNDYASKAHCLVRWYNLRRFMILSPKSDVLVSDSSVKLILSSACIALTNIDCHVPIFLQIYGIRNNFYQGISDHNNIRTCYEMILFKHNLKQYSYLSELVSLFREKVGCTLSDPIDVKIRLNYCLKTFDLFLEPGNVFEGNEHDDEESLNHPETTARRPSAKPFMQDMRSGASYEQVVEALDDCVPHPYKILKFLHVAALWPQLSDKVITDSQVHSDLDASEAPTWTMRCVTSDNCNMKIVHETQVLYKLFCEAIDFAYNKLDAETLFDDCDRESIKALCLRLSYQLATQPEVLLSDKITDSIRKIVALMFHRAAELTEDTSALDEIAEQLKKKPSLSQIYKNFTRKHRPSVKEFIIKANVSRPFKPITSPALPQRMFCTVSDSEFRLCGAFSEHCN